jgi:monoamine oxidase
MHNRRDLLKLFLASPLMLSACRPSARPQEPIGLPPEDSVIVIGAGIAGLAAAHELKRYKMNVIVLEARDRVGGRIHTDRSWKAPIDLGASWIHGVRKNPIAHLVKKFNLKTKDTDYEAQEIYDQGKALSKKEKKALEDKFYELFDKLVNTAADMQKKKLTDITVDNAIQDLLPQGTTPEADYRRLQHMLSVEIDNEYAASPEELSLFYWQEGKSLRGEDAVFLNGYDEIPKKLAEGLDIKLNHVVSAIEYSDAGVNISTNQGPFTADRVIITLPLGVLKSGSITFSPELPVSKISAIQNLGMGLLDKVYLKFPSNFWAQKGTEIISHVSVQRGSFPYIVNMEHYTGDPVLQMFNAASVAEGIEQQRERDVIARATAALREMFGDKVVEPEDYKITHWRQDPFSLGSYSYLAYGSSPESFDALAAPVGDRLFFAGEATSRDYNATVHGAYLSGLREARRWR